MNHTKFDMRGQNVPEVVEGRMCPRILFALQLIH